MISIFGDFAYDFPIKIKLKYRLKDFLEKKVDEKYYLSEKDIERVSSWQSQEKPIENAIDVEQDSDKVMGTLTARGAGEEHSGMKLVKETNKTPLKDGDGIYLFQSKQFGKNNSLDQVCTTIKANKVDSGVAIKESTDIQELRGGN